jgi:hypothetical protein
VGHLQDSCHLYFYGKVSRMKVWAKKVIDPKLYDKLKVVEVQSDAGLIKVLILGSMCDNAQW